MSHMHDECVQHCLYSSLHWPYCTVCLCGKSHDECLYSSIHWPYCTVCLCGKSHDECLYSSLHWPYCTVCLCGNKIKDLSRSLLWSQFEHMGPPPPPPPPPPLSVIGLFMYLILFPSGEYHSRSQPRVRRGAVQRWRHGVGYSSSEDTEESHFQQRATAGWFVQLCYE